MWGEYDTKNAVDNKVLSKTEELDNIYVFRDKINNKKNGNYLHLRIDSMDEKYIEVCLGNFIDNEFNLKYKYNIKILSGKHDYLIRISNDLNWYFDNINAIFLNEKFDDIKINILEGD